MITFLTALLTRILCTSLESISEQHDVDDREKMRKWTGEHSQALNIIKM